MKSSQEHEVVVYDENAVRNWIAPATLNKAYDYVDAVSGISWGRRMLFADVKGSEKLPYSVDIVFNEDRKGLRAMGRCSCPVGSNCKHVAAALLANLEKKAGAGEGPRPEMLRWLESFRAQCQADRPSTARKAAKVEFGLIYRLEWASRQQCFAVAMYKTRRGAGAGTQRPGETWNNVQAALLKPPKFITDEDLPILRALWTTRKSDYDLNFYLRGKAGAELLDSLVATGRLYLDIASQSGAAAGNVACGPLHGAAPRAGRIGWHIVENGLLRPTLHVEPGAEAVIAVEPPWYLDPSSLEAGPVDLPQAMQSLPAHSVAAYLAMPPIRPAEAELVTAVLGEVAPALPPPPLDQLASLRTVDVEPVPVLALEARSVYLDNNARYAYRPNMLDYATVEFFYDDIRVAAFSDASLFSGQEQQMVQVRRRPESEAARIKELTTAGLRRRSVEHHEHHGLPRQIFTPDGPDAWPGLVQHNLPLLRGKGWRVTMASDSRFNVIDIDAIDGVAHQRNDGWFGLELGINVNGRTVRLEPLLLELFRRDSRWRKGRLDQIADDESIELTGPAGERLRLKAARLKPVVGTLIDLFDTLAEGDLMLSPQDTGRLDALASTGRWEFRGDAAVRELAPRDRKSVV